MQVANLAWWAFRGWQVKKKQERNEKKTWFINLGFFYLLGGVNRGNDFFETQFLHL